MDLFGDSLDEPEEEVAAPLLEEPEGLPSARESDFCLGHEAVEKQLLELFASGHLPHGLVFSGPKGIGKATMAFRFAKFLLKHGGGDPNQDSMFTDAAPAFTDFAVSKDDPVFRRVASGGHPDLFTVERAYDAAKNRYKAGVDVAEIRKVAPFLRMTSSDGGWRVVIIDDADTMNRNAQNALLKILEEPPKNTLLILVAHRAGALIPTIKSRTRAITFNPLPNEALKQLMEKQGGEISWSEMDRLITLSEGSAGQAIEYIENDGLQIYEKMMGAFESYPSWNWPDLHRLADELARAGQDQKFESFVNLLQWKLFRLASAKARGQGASEEEGGFGDMLKNSSLAQLLKICENLQEHFEKVRAANLDKRQAVLGAFSMIAA